MPLADNMLREFEEAGDTKINKKMAGQMDGSIYIVSSFQGTPILDISSPCKKCVCG